MANNRARESEEKLLGIQIENSKNQNELEISIRENEDLKTKNNNLEAEIQKLLNRLKEMDINFKETKNNLERIKSEVK